MIELLDISRNRLLCLAGLLTVIALGLATRSTSINWPPFISLHAGDALWTIASYLGISLLLPRMPVLPLGILSIGISWFVELTQLLTWKWLSDLRATQIGRLFLGIGFQWLDFPRYAAGAAAISILDAIFLVKQTKLSIDEE